MNQARRAFERFEKSDSWLPVILLSLTGVIATIAMISAAESLSAKAVRRAENLFFALSKSAAWAVVQEPTLRKLSDDEVSDAVVKGFGAVQGWSAGYTFVGAYEWNAGVPQNSQTEAAQVLVQTYCWIGEAESSLLVASMIIQPEGSDAVVGARLGGVEILSIEDKSQRHLITSSSEFIPAAPWESIVSLGQRAAEVEPTEMFSAHAQHIVDKQLARIPLENLQDFLVKATLKKGSWLLQRGGLSPEELEQMLNAEGNPMRDVSSARIRTAYKLGFRFSLAARATELVREEYASSGQAGDVSEMVVVHECLCPIELQSQIDRLPAAAIDRLRPVPPSERLPGIIDDAIGNGIELRRDCEALTRLLESETIATKVQEMTEPLKATIYKWKEPTNE